MTTTKINGRKCKDCGSAYLPFKAVCQNCYSKNLVDVQFDGKGSIFAYTIIRIGPEQFRGQEPYPIAVVKLDSGPLVSGRLLVNDIDKIENGMKVVLERKDDVGFWFRINSA